VGPVRSLDGYLRRIGLADQRPDAADGAGLRTVHRAHATSIPFENLDPLRGIPTSLEPAALERKLVTERRGGFCFEHNTLLGAALAALGYEVSPMLARVGRRDGVGTTYRERDHTGDDGGAGDDEAEVRPLSHLVLQVRDRDGAVWHADAGFGAGERGSTLLEPIPFGPGGEYEQSGWRYRVQEHGDELVLTARASDGAWWDMYSFAPEPVPAIDVVVGNWFASTYPGSPFTRRLVVASQEGASRTALRDADGILTLRTLTPTGQTTTEVAREHLPRLLAERFGLPGWRFDDGGRPLAPATAPSSGSSAPAARDRRASSP
jgi:N-hydroxyarylamine O-acetyltransferase